MADNTWNNSDADNAGNNPNNWSLGRVPIVGDTMVFDGGVSDADCTFSADISCDGWESRNNCRSKITLGGNDVAVVGGVSLTGPLVIIDPGGSILTCGTFDADTINLLGLTTWYLNASISAAMHNLTVRRCNASGGEPVDAGDACLDGGFNVNVDFGGLSSSSSSESSPSSSSWSSGSSSSSSFSSSSSSSSSSSLTSSSSSGEYHDPDVAVISVTGRFTFSCEVSWPT